MKKIFLLVLTATLLHLTVKAQTYFLPTENFQSVINPGLPSGWADTSGLWISGTPDSVFPIYSLLTPGASLNTAQQPKAIGINGFYPMQGSSIVTTPVFSIPAGSQTPYLSCDIAYFGNLETLTLIISVDSGATWNDLSVIQASAGGHWETRSFLLSAYIGQSEIRLGFKYDNGNDIGFGVAISNVKVWAGNDIALTAVTGGQLRGIGNNYFQNVGSTTNIQGNVQNLGTENITSYTVNYQQGTNPVQAYTKTGVNILPLAIDGFTHNVPFNVAAIQHYPIHVWVTIPNDGSPDNDSADLNIYGINNSPLKKPLFEEITSTTCPPCVKGAVYMDSMAVKYPDSASLIALHFPNDAADPMEVPVYDSFIKNSIIGYNMPGLVYDRIAGHDVERIFDLYHLQRSRFGYAKITMGTPTIAGNTASVPVTIIPAVDISNPKIALVVTESNISDTSAAYDQVNGFANGSGGPMGGFENLPGRVKGLRYHFVARSISATPAGSILQSLPAVLLADNTYNVTLTTTLANGWKPQNLQYIVMMLDSATLRVMNTATTPLPTLLPIIPPAPTPVANVNAGFEKAVVFPNPAGNKSYLRIDATAESNGVLVITDAVGRNLTMPENKQIRKGINLYELPVASWSNGLYFVNFSNEKVKISLKLQVVK